MKRRLCWQLDDILYLKFHYTNNEAWNREHASPELKDRIRSWNQADVLLYDFFNKTLWKEIEYEGSTFWKEVAEFKRSQRAMEKTCVRSESTPLPKDEKFALFDVPTVQQVMRSGVARTRVQPSGGSTHFTPSISSSQDTSSGDSGGDSYKKSPNLRDVLVRSGAIRVQAYSNKTMAKTKDENNNNNNNIDIDNDNNNFNNTNNNNSISYLNDNSNNNISYLNENENNNNFNSVTIPKTSHEKEFTVSNEGNLYTDTTDVTGSGSETSITPEGTVERLLSRTVRPWDTYLCKKLLMGEVEYLDYFRKKHVYGKMAQRKWPRFIQGVPL